MDDAIKSYVEDVLMGYAEELNMLSMNMVEMDEIAACNMASLQESLENIRGDIQKICQDLNRLAERVDSIEEKV